VAIDVVGIGGVRVEVEAGEKLAGQVRVGRIDARVQDGDVNGARAGGDIPSRRRGDLGEMPLGDVGGVVGGYKRFSQIVLFDKADVGVFGEGGLDLVAGRGGDLDSLYPELGDFLGLGGAGPLEHAVGTCLVDASFELDDQFIHYELLGGWGCTCQTCREAEDAKGAKV